MRGEKSNTINVKKLLYAGALIALGILLPQAFHMFGQGAGMTLLPIHIPVLLAGAILGGVYGGAVGAIVPMLSFFITGMPPMPLLWFMMFELIGYGVAMGVLTKKCNVYVALLLSMVAGRIVYAIAIGAGSMLFGMDAAFMTHTAFMASIVRGMPGMIVQIAIIPIIYKQLKNGGLLFDK